MIFLMGICCCIICFHILKVKAETGATERRREAVTKTSEEDHDREKVKNRKKVIVYEAYPKNGKKIFDDSRKVDLEVRPLLTYVLYVMWTNRTQKPPIWLCVAMLFQKMSGSGE